MNNYDYDRYLEARLDRVWNTDYYTCKCGCQFDNPFKYDEGLDKWLGCPDCGSKEYSK